MLADRIGEIAEPGAQALDRWKLRIGFDARSKALDQRLQAGDVDALLAAEVLEDQAVGDAGGLRDLVDGDLVVVPVAEDLERGGEELGAALAGPLGCQGT